MRRKCHLIYLECNRKDPDVQCEVCNVWYRQRCVLPPGLKKQQIEKMHWLCDKCSKAGLVRVNAYNEAATKFNEEKLEFKKKKKDLSADLASVAY